MPSVHTGLDVLLAEPDRIPTSTRLGLLVNQASVDRRFRPACDVIAERFPGQLTALLSPQHGFWGEEQANMIESSHSRHPRLGMPIHSLYADARRPTAEMLEDLDLLLVDLQDVGTRVYTFVWTVLETLRACAAVEVKVLILDRPNLIGGREAEGAVLQEEFRSFVGGACMPMRHGLTIGELGQWLNESLAIGAELECVPMRGWQRELLFPETGLPWVPPSPNLPTFESAVVYPGQVLLEGTNLSEGRGTTRPFETVGAPFFDELELTERLNGRSLPGVTFRAVRFRPTFDKWRGEICGGVFLHVTDAGLFRPYRTTLELLSAAHDLYPGELRWNPPPYEYEMEKMPIDILSGDDRLRTWLDENGRLSETETDVLCGEGVDHWREQTQSYRLYE
jgi:uncharacterized protein YbbC (DUF1343 family)